MFAFIYYNYSHSDLPEEIELPSGPVHGQGDTEQEVAVYLPDRKPFEQVLYSE